MTDKDRVKPGQTRKAIKHGDEAVISAILALEASPARPRSRREAIKMCAPSHIAEEHMEAYIRRLQDNIANTEGMAEDKKRNAVLQIHIEDYPAKFARRDDFVGFSVVVPGHRGNGRTKLAVAVNCSRIRALTMEAPDDVREPIDPESSLLGARWLPEVFDLLNIAPVVRDGVFALAAGPCPAAIRLADRLVARWKEAGLARRHDAEDALEYEIDRLTESGLAAVKAETPFSMLLVLNVYYSLFEDVSLLENLVMATPARIALLSSLVSFAHPALGGMDDEVAAQWSGRHVECLATHLDQWAVPKIDLGRTIDMTDAAWLHAHFGARSLAPISCRTLEALLRWQHWIDPVRIASDSDAAALVAMVEAVLSWDRYGARRRWIDDGLRLLFVRLNEDGRNYFECRAALSKTSRRGSEDERDSLARAVATATDGGETICRYVAVDLVLPVFLALAHGKRRPSSIPYSEIEAQARAMVLDRRGIDDVARAVESLSVHEAPSWRMFRLEPGDAEHFASESEIEAAWSALASVLSPAWRIRGLRGIRDQFRSAAMSSETPAFETSTKKDDDARSRWERAVSIVKSNTSGLALGSTGKTI